MKKYFKKIAIAALAIAISSFAVQAATIIGVNPGTQVINSQGTTQTNTSWGGATGTTNGVWPVFIPPSTIVTNVTRIDVSAGKDVAIQFSAAPLGANDNSNIVMQIGRNVSGDSPTNAFGTGMRIEWFDSITNTLSLTAGQQTTVNYLYGSANSVASGAVKGDGGIKTFYIGWITVPALTTLTNYQVFIGSQ